jgi:hypothetical protein
LTLDADADRELAGKLAPGSLSVPRLRAWTFDRAAGSWSYVDKLGVGEIKQYAEQSP